MNNICIAGNFETVQSVVNGRREAVGVGGCFEALQRIGITDSSFKNLLPLPQTPVPLDPRLPNHPLGSYSIRLPHKTCPGLTKGAELLLYCGLLFHGATSIIWFPSAYIQTYHVSMYVVPTIQLNLV